MAEQIERRRLRGIVSGPVSTPNGPTSAFSALDGTVEIVNVAQTRNSSGEDLAPGEGTVLSVGPDDTFVDASYIKTGVLDANLLRTGQLQTIASWNNKNYGSTEDSIESQQGFTGGYVYLEDWYTVSENTVYVKFADWAGYEASNTVGTTAAGNFFEVGDYVRVSGAYFGQDGDLVSADGTNANVGLVDQDDGPVKYGSVVAVDTTGTGLFYSVTETGKTTLDAGKLARSQDYIPTISRVVRVSSITSTKLGPPNPSEIYEVVVTTLGEHGLVVGDYVELASCGQVFSGVWYVVATPDENTFIYRNRFGIDADASLNVADLPDLSAPTAIRVRKAYAVSSNGDLTAASINIRTARTQSGGNPIFQVLNDSVVIRKPDGTVLLSATTVGSSIDVGTVTADEITVGGDVDPNQIVRVGTNVSPAFQGIWAGNANPNSAEFSVDLDGNLVASNANISGTIQAAAGSIGGFTIGATALTATNIVADSSGYVSVGSGDNVAVMSGADANYRFWAGKADAATANFLVDKAGNITARSFSLTGVGKIDAIDAITVSDVLGSGVVTNAKIATVSADKVQTNTLTLSGLSATAISSTNFIVSNTGSITASDVTLSNSDLVQVGASQVGSINLKPNAVGTTNVGGALFTVWSNHDAASLAASTYSTWNISDITGDGPSSTVGATITVTIQSGHDIGVGQYVSFHGVTGTNWTLVDSQTEAVRVKTATATTFTFAAPYAMGTATLSSATIRGYKTLTFVAPGGVFVADAVGATLSPGMLGIGSMALGSNFESIGGDSPTSGINGTPKPADGEIVFTSATTNPIYDGGANLYSSDGALNLNTSGSFVAGSNITAGGIATADAFVMTGAQRLESFNASNMSIRNNADSAYNGIVLERVYPGGQTTAYLDHTGNFVLNDTLDITGSLTVSSNATVTGEIYAGGSIVDPSPLTTTATTNAAIWVIPAVGEPYGLRRNSSSARYKTNIVDADAAVLEAAKKIRARHFESTIADEAGATRLGFIAEEVLAAGLSHGVGYNENGIVETIDTTALLAALYAHVADLERRIAELEGRA